MRIERGSAHVNVFVPIDGPAGWDLAATTIEYAYLLPGSGPQEADWQDADWSVSNDAVEGVLLTDVTALVDDDYILKVRLTAGLEQVVLTSGRVTLG